MRLAQASRTMFEPSDAMGAPATVQTRADTPLSAECKPIAYSTDIAPLLAGLEGNPFQSPEVLAAWFGTFSGRGTARECFLVTLRNAEGTPVLALPLTRRRVAGFTRLELPDSGVIDFTTPFLCRGTRPQLPAPAELWALIVPALPEADLVVFRRMAAGGPGLANPLFLHPLAQESRFVSWRCDSVHDMASHRAGLSRPFRKKLRRNRARFFELPGAQVLVPRSREEALPLLEAMEAMQENRIRTRGLPYGLNCPRVKAFYRRLLDTGIESGATQIVGLKAQERIIAVGFAVLSRAEAVYLRVACDFEAYGALTPGLLVTDAAIGEASARGVRVFDFGMGSYPFKAQMGGRASPLRDLVLPLSARGWLPALYLRLRLTASLNPLLRRLFGRRDLPARST